MREINTIPEGWSQARFDSFSVLQRGYDLPVQLRRDGAIQILGSNGVVGYHNEYKALGNGVVTGRSGSLGQVWYVENNYWPLNTALYVKDFCGNSPKFVYYFMQALKLESFGTGTGVPTLNRNDVHAEEVVFPPLPEQRKIAAILTSVDSVIEQTQTQINKLKMLKTGMMQELLSPTPENYRTGEGKVAFKDSPLGPIPEGWEVMTLGAIVSPKGLQTGPFGAQLHSHEYVDSGVPVVMPKDMKNNRVDINRIAMIHPSKAEELQKHRIQAGDILFSRRGDIGRFALIKEDNEDWVCGTGCLRARFGEGIVPAFIAAYLTTDYAVDWLNNNAVGQTMLNLNTSILADLPIVLPGKREQLKIANAFTSLEMKLERTQRKLLATESLKKALMQDLLTGKVRVNTNA